MKIKAWLILMVALSAACTANHTHTHAPADDELPTLSVTLWSSRTELFMEHPTLVQGEVAAFLVHLTDLESYRPVTEGRVTLELEKEAGVARFESDAPSRPGIFRLEATAPSPGLYQGYLKVETPEIEDTHPLGEMQVFRSADEALRERAAPEDDAGTISYLKEQQWGTDFATERVAPRKIQQSIRVPAVVRPRGGGEGSAISPIRGRLSTSSDLPLPGQRVKKGDVVATVIPFTANPQDSAGLKLELSWAETDLAQAQRRRERLEALLAERAVPARRVEEIKADEARAQARVVAAKTRLAQFSRSQSSAAKSEEDYPVEFEVRAPLAGIVRVLSSVPGSSVSAGEEILKIVDVDRVWVVAEVPEANSGDLFQLKTAEFQVPGVQEHVQLPGRRGSIERISNIVDPESRRIPVILAVSNGDGLLRIGQSLSVRLGIGNAAETVCAPVSSIIDDAGSPVVFIQIAGESFERRPVRTGFEWNGYVQIREGLQPGERIVSRGAYPIRLSALSTQIPAHGHVH
jgi:RND family efflux transporter MFP subunit